MTRSIRAGHLSNMTHSPSWLAAFVAGIVTLATTTRVAAEEEPPPPIEPVQQVSRSGIALEASYGVVNGRHAQVFRGLQLSAATTLTHKTFVGLVAGFDEGIDTSTVNSVYDNREHTHYDHAYWDVWFGPQVAWGAPYRSESWWGMSFQSGITAGFRDTTLYSGFGGGDPARYVSIFGATSATFALCRCQRVAPFVGVSGRMVLDQFGESVQSAGIDLGIALR